jgi:hypothetical protein
MGLAQYSIVPVDEHWGVLHDGIIEGDYATKEAAFEAASVAASLSIVGGHEIHISVPAAQAGESTLGIRDLPQPVSHITRDTTRR